MIIEQQVVNNVCVLMPQGRLDAATVPHLRERMTADAAFLHLVVDFSAVEFIDSSGLGFLMAGARRLREQNGDLKIACLTDNVRRVFELTRAHRLFDIYDDPEAAVRSFAHDESK